MANIFREIGSDEEIFKDERVLLPEYLPEVLPHRESQVKDIALSLKPAASGSRSENIIITGKPGTGKTSTVRFVLNQLSDYSSRVAPVYVNCWEFSTRHSILSKIASSLGEFVPRRGIATDEIFERILEVVKKERKMPIVALDEIDRLMVSQYGQDKVLYDLIRAGENYGSPIGVIGIANSPDFLSRADQRIRSSLAQRRMEFKNYSPAELKDILSSRARLAFFPNSLDKEVVPVCAAHAGKHGGDARLGIGVLWKAGKAAERESAKKVLVRHCKQAFEATEELVKEDHSEALKPIELDILELLKSHGELATGELYGLISKKHSETDRTVRNYITNLESLGFIEAEEKQNEGGRGKRRILRIAP